MIKVALVNLSRASAPTIVPPAIDILGTALKYVGRHEVKILDLNPSIDPYKDIDEFFSKEQFDFVGLSMRNVYDLYLPTAIDPNLKDKGNFLPLHKKLIDRIKRHVQSEKIIVGGAGFSISPEAVLKRVGLRYGVKGLGEQKILEIAKNIEETGKISEKDFEIFDAIYDPPLQVGVRREFMDYDWYYKNGGQIGVRAAEGCLHNCNYCPDPHIKGFREMPVRIEMVIEELKQLFDKGIRDVHFTNPEVNQRLDYSKSFAKAILASGLPKKGLRLYGHFNLTPFDDEYAKLLSEAGFKGVNFSLEHTDEEMLRSMRKDHTKEDAKFALELCKKYGIRVMFELLHGSPGDTPEKMYAALDYLLKLDPYVIGLTVGIAVQENTLLWYQLKDNPNQPGFYHTGEPFIDNSIYVDPSFGTSKEDMYKLFREIEEYVGDDIYRVMIPKVNSTHGANNLTQGSDRIKEQLKKGLKGAGWFHYREMLGS